MLKCFEQVCTPVESCCEDGSRRSCAAPLVTLIEPVTGLRSVSSLKRSGCKTQLLVGVPAQQRCASTS